MCQSKIFFFEGCQSTLISTLVFVQIRHYKITKIRVGFKLAKLGVKNHENLRTRCKDYKEEFGEDFHLFNKRSEETSHHINMM